MFGIDDAIAAGLQLVNKVIDRVIPDPVAAANAKLAVLQLQQTGELARITEETDLAKLAAASDQAQIALNNTEAASGSWFQSGWRPATAWVCVAAFSWNYVVNPISAYILVLFGANIPIVAAFDTTVMLPVLLGLLGLGGMRSYERTQGVSKE